MKILNHRKKIFFVEVGNFICPEHEYYQNILIKFYLFIQLKNIIFALEPKAYHAL